MHYEITKETQQWEGKTLHRIRYTEAIPETCIRKGKLGGWIEKPDNLCGRALLLDNAIVCDDAALGDRAIARHDSVLCGRARAGDDAMLFGRAMACGEAALYGWARAHGHVVLSGRARAYDAVILSGQAMVCGDAVLRGCMHITGGLWRSTPLYIQGSRWPVYISSPDTLTIGCQQYTFAEWRAQWRKIAEQHDALDVVQEYAAYYNLVAERYGFEKIDLEDRGQMGFNQNANT